MIGVGFNVMFFSFGMDYHGTLDNFSSGKIYLGLTLTTTSAMSFDNTSPPYPHSPLSNVPGAQCKR